VPNTFIKRGTFCRLNISVDSLSYGRNRKVVVSDQGNLQIVFLCRFTCIFLVNGCIFSRIQHPPFDVYSHFCSLIVKGWSCKKPCEVLILSMAQVEELLELLNTLILSSVDNIVTIEKTNFAVCCNMTCKFHNPK
jgi:hypothetical protein